MSKLERFLLIGLGMLVALAVAVIVIVPRQTRPPVSSEQTLAPGETETMTARVIEVLEEGTVELGEGSVQPYQRLLLRAESGSLAGQEVVVEEGTVNIISQERLFHPGDRVYLERIGGMDSDRFYISDFVRTGPLFWIVALFMGLVALVGRGRGMRSLTGTLFSLVVIFAFVPVAVLIAQPFNDILSEKVERLYSGQPVDDAFSLRRFIRSLAIGFGSSLRLTVLTLLLLGCALTLNLIPVIGQVLATAASLAITIRFLSLEFTSYSMDRRDYTYAQRRAFLRSNRARTVGMGAMAACLMVIPIVNALFIPVSAVGGTLLFCDTELAGRR